MVDHSDIPEELPSAPPPSEDQTEQTPLLAGDADPSMRKLRRHTTPFGRAATIVFVVAAVGLALLYWRSSRSQEEELASLEAIAQMEDASQVPAALRQLYPTIKSRNVKVRVLKNLGHLRDAESVPLMTGALEDEAEVRGAAAWALARVGRPAAEPARDTLLKVLPKTGQVDRTHVIWALAKLGETRAADAIVDAFKAGRLQGEEDFDPRVIMEVVGLERLSQDELLNHDEEPVRRLAAVALAEAASPKAVEPLARLLSAETARPDKEQSVEIIRAAASGLGRSGDPSAAKPLVELMQAKPEMRSIVLDALRRSTGATDLAVLLQQSTEMQTRRDLARLLAETHDPAAAPALATLLDSDDLETRSTAALALAELSDERAAAVLMQLVRTDDRSLSDRALEALRDVAPAIPATDLLALLDEMPTRRASILRAMGRSGDAAVASRLEAELKGPDAPAAARALADLGLEASYKKLRKMVPRPKNVDLGALTAADRTPKYEDLRQNRAAAILAVGRFGRPEAADDLIVVVEDPKDDFELRALAAASLGQVATAEQLGLVLDKINDGALNKEARQHYVRALWQKPQPTLNSRLLDLVAGNAPEDLRRAAALAVGYSADPDADARLAELLDKEHSARPIAFAILLGGSAENGRRLLQKLTKDPQLAGVLRDYVLDDDRGWFRLLTEDMFRSGEVWRRLQVAHILMRGVGQTRYSFAHQNIVDVLRSGWGGVGGVTAQQVRINLREALKDSDETRRQLAADALASLGERGLLLRVRDEGGPGAEQARTALARK